MFALQTQYVLKQPSETWDGKPRRILPTLRVSPTYVFLHRTLAIEPTHSIRHRRTQGRVIYAESASDLTTHKLKFTHQRESYGHQKFTKSFRDQMFWDWRIWFGHCKRLPLNGNNHPGFQGFISIWKLNYIFKPSTKFSFTVSVYLAIEVEGEGRE